MHKSFLYIVFLLIFPINIWAHDGYNAYFNIEQIEGRVIIHAELPWTIRNALLIFSPKLEKSKSKEEFEKAFFIYVKSNLILTDFNGINLDLISVYEVKKNNHSHQTNYIITYKGILHQVQNSILFNVNSNQINHHTFENSASKLIFKTTNNQHIFTFKENRFENQYKNYLWLLALFCTIPIILLKIKHKTIKT